MTETHKFSLNSPLFSPVKNGPKLLINSLCPEIQYRYVRDIKRIQYMYRERNVASEIYNSIVNFKYESQSISHSNVRIDYM